MAVSFIGAGTASNSAGGTSSSLSPSIHASTADGDLLIAVVYHAQNTLTPPGGWTQIGTNQDSGANIRSSIWFRTAASEPASYTWSISTAGIFGVGHFTFRGCEIPVADSGQVARTTADPFTGPTVTLAESGIVVTCGGSRGSSATEITHSTASADNEAADWGNDGGATTRNGFLYYSGTLAAGDYGRQVNIDTGTITEGTTFSLALEESGGSAPVSANAGAVTASVSVPSTILDVELPLTDERVPTYEIFIDWDNDGGLDFGNFELHTEDWAATNSGTVVELSDEQVHLGQANSLRVTWDGSAGQDIWKHKECEPGRHYTFSGWVWVASGSQAVRLEVDGVVTGSASTTVNAWEYLEVEFTATAAVHKLRLEPTATPASGHIVYFDQVMVICDGEDVTDRTLGLRTPLSFTYGRDTARSLSEFSPGETSMTLDNRSQDYSPDNTASPLYGLAMPGRACIVRATYNFKTHTLFNGFIDDFVLAPDIENRALDVTALDILQKLNEAVISTELYHSIQTGEAVGYVLDAIGWPTDRRDLDQGASTIRWWWEDEGDAFEALSKIVQAEGPPAFAFVDAGGNFIFRDRHHRVLNSASVTSQATFVSGNDDQISFVGTGAQYSSVSSGTTYDLNRPDDAKENDLLIGFVVTEQNSTISQPAGWTVVRSVAVDTGTDDLALFVLVKDAETTDPSLWSGTVSVASTRRTAFVLAYRGTAPAADQFISENGSTDTADTPMSRTTPSITGGEAGNWRLACFVAHDNDTAATGWGTYSPSGTERFDVEVGTSDPVLIVAAADSGGTVASTGPRTMTATLGGATSIDTSATWIGLIRPWQNTGLRFDLDGFEYDIGWKDIVNSVSYVLEERNPTFKQVVWESEDQLFVIPANTTHEIIVEAEEPFYNAAIPLKDIDYVLQTGTVTITLSRTSGASTTIFIKANTAAVVVGMRLQATPVPVQREVIVKLEDQTSINNHGIHSLEEETDASWLNPPDAEAVAKAILGLRAERLPLITFKIGNSNNEKMFQILSRDLSDRIHVVENETFTDHDFFIERIEQNIEEVGWNHTALFGCERAPNQVTGVFKFGSAGPGFDTGRLGTQGGNNADDVLILGVGQLDQKVLGI
jgi:hypothetical protein